MAELNRAVIDSLKVTFSDAKFEQHLRDQAADTEQVAARRAERDNLLLKSRSWPPRRPGSPRPSL